MEKSSITTSMIIALIIGLVLGFLAGAWWAKSRAANTNLTAIDTPLDGTATTTEISLIPGDTSSATNPLSAAVASAVPAVPGQASVAINKTALADASLATVANQPAGSLVTVANITVAAKSWVAVRDSLDGAIGNILGAAMVPAGTYTNLQVKLLRPTVKAYNYFLTVFADDGDGVFDYKKDQMLEQNGQVRVVPFSAL